jgi:23S rRNA (uracil1939-C5)-methyltransferase
MASKGLGIGKVEGKVYFIEGAVPGDIADVNVTTDKKKYAEGNIAALLRRHPIIAQSPCASTLAPVAAANGNTLNMKSS